MRDDLEGLKRLIQLPAEVERAEWQTGNRAPHGDDWWLAAVLEASPEDVSRFLPGPGTEEVFETPPGLEYASSFAALRSLPGAEPVGSDQVRLVTATHGADAFIREPLLQGRAIRLAEDRLLVVLWTS